MEKNISLEKTSFIKNKKVLFKSQKKKLEIDSIKRIKKRNNKKINKHQIVRKPNLKKKKKSLVIYRVYLNFIRFIIILFLCFLLVIEYLSNNNINKTEEKIKSEDYKIILNKSIEKNIEEEYKDVQNYMDICINGTRIDKDKNKIYYPSKNPKISIVITVYNGEAYLNTSILSIQNQDFKDVEIVIVDDASKDNSVKLIKELMKTEPRIVLYENEENKGMLYTKSKGVLKAKGKYVMTLDMDDIYVQREAFSILYSEAEKNNLDILGFIAVHTGKKIDRGRPNFSDKLRIIYQPELSNLMYQLHPGGRVTQFGGNLLNHFIKTDVFKRVIKLVDDKNMNIRMNYHDDFILFFLLTRNASSAKYIDRLFYVWLHTWNQNDTKVKFRTQIKEENMNNNKCFAYLNFLEILFKNTKNTVDDKKIAFSQLEDWYLNIHCRNNEKNRDKAIEVFKLFLDSKYISEDDKKKIQNFIDNKN